MKNQKLLTVLTGVNLALLIFLLAQMVWPVGAQVAGSVLRGRALEIVDAQGRVRAGIKVQPAGTTPNGEPYPETVMFRLIDPNGRPFVKVGGSEQGAGLSFVGDSDVTHIVLKAQGAESSLKLTNKDGRQHLLKP